MITPAVFVVALLTQLACLAGIIAYLIWAHAKERAALLDRIMARDLREYREDQGKPLPQRSHNVLTRNREERAKRERDQEE